MIHIVNPQTNEILDYITLDNIIDDTHKKSLESYLETYDAIVLGGNNFSYDEHLEKRNHIIIPNEDGTYQEFILFEVDKYRDTEGRKTHFYAHATYLELKKAKVIYPTRREGLTLSQHAGWALNDTGWTVGIVESEGVRTFNIENHTNPYEFIKRIAREFEVELRFRVEHDGRRITARYIDFLERIGDWKGREVEFGKDLDSIRRVEKQDIVTALLGLGPERDDGTRIEVLVTDEEALQRWGRVDEHGNLHHLIEPYEIQSDRQEMTEEEARQYTRTALDKRINTQVTYETTILDLEEVPGLEHEKIRFGDTIRIKDTYFNPPLYLEARVFEIERSIKNKAKKDIKLGDYVEYTEEEVNAIWNQLRNEIRRRLDRMAIVSINSTAGNVFKNAQGETELTARTFVGGTERDEDGTLYDYQWMRFDKDGNHDTDFYAEGKTITVKASDIDEKATYRVLVAYELEVINTAEITISNVFDGEDGEQGPPGPKGDKGDKGDPGPQGPPGTSVVSIVEYYLATDQSSGVTTDTPGWTTTMQQMTPEKRYLWNYERINFSDGTHQNTNPVIIGVYGDEGEEGRSVIDITEYYLATSESSGVTRDTSGWTTTMQVTTPEKKYLWNYEEITWNKAPTKTYTEPVIIGVHGEQGPKGEDGKTFYTWIKYADTPTSGMSDSPEGKEYIGIAYNKETPTPSTNYADYTWSKFKGEQGVPGPPGEDGQPTYTWVKYADDEHGNGMSDSPDGKLYIGLAFNKTTPEESNNPADYTWSLMPQNIEIGGRNLLKNTSDEWTILQLSDSQYYFQQGTDTRLEVGVTYTFGILVEKVSDDDVPISVNIGTGTKGNFLREKGSRIPVEFGKRFTLTFTITENDIANGYEYFAWRLRNERQITTIRFKEVKLEKGNKATDWTPAPEDVQEQIDEAKQEAEEAKQTAQQAQTTADGKNSVFTQSTAPPTAGRKIGDIWFDTSRDNLMHRFDGTQWVEAKWGEQSIVANSITANHIKSLVGLNVNDQFIVDSQGNVKFAGHLEGATGSFKGEIEASGLNIIPIHDNISGSNVLFYLEHPGIYYPDGEPRYIETFVGDTEAPEITWRARDKEGTELLFGFSVRGSFKAEVLRTNVGQADIIVEQGENENGTYIRYANGIQICWTRISDFVIDIAIGNIYRSESQIWTYPAAFDDTYPVVVSGGIAAVNRWLGITGSPLGESVYIRGYGATSASSGYAAYVMAIGRWK